jgi:class 3 adenylate cyclase
VKAAQPGEVLVSASVAGSDPGSQGLGFEAAEPLSLKGYDERVDAYRLNAPSL